MTAATQTILEGKLLERVTWENHWKNNYEEPFIYFMGTVMSHIGILKKALK